MRFLRANVNACQCGRTSHGPEPRVFQWHHCFVRAHQHALIAEGLQPSDAVLVPDPYDSTKKIFCLEGLGLGPTCHLDAHDRLVETMKSGGQLLPRSSAEAIIANRAIELFLEATAEHGLTTQWLIDRKLWGEA